LIGSHRDEGEGVDARQETLRHCHVRLYRQWTERRRRIHLRPSA